MKKLLPILFCFAGFIANAQLNISILNPGNNTVITCAAPSIFLQGNSSSTITPITYGWNTPTGPVTGATINVTSPGVYTLAALAGTVTASQTIAIGINTFVPISSVSPLSQSISCSFIGITNVTCTASSPTVNLTHNILSPNGGTLSANTLTTSYTPQSIGVFTYVLTNNSNGCQAVKYFTVTANLGFPTYSLTSPQNFTLGCSTKSVASINISNASTNPPGGPVSYTLLFPGSGSVTSSGTLALASQFTVNIPGTYTAITKDNVSLCESRVPFSVIQNTVIPDLSVSVPQQVLSCAQPSVQLQASSITGNVAFLWSDPTGTVASANLNVNTNLTVSPTNTLLGNYTITVKDNNNLCSTNSVIPIYQNLFKPKAVIYTGIVSNSVISCGNPTIMLTNSSTSGIPVGSVFPVNLPVTGLLWNGPSPLLPASNSSTYLATTGGVYTLTAKDLNNGCISTTVISITDTRVLPAVNDPGPFTVGCPNGTVQLSPNFPNGTSGLTFSWTSPANATVSGANSPVLTTNAPGYYTLTVTNTVTGCYNQVTLSAWACVGIDKQTNSINSLKVSPNPAENNVSVQLKNPGKKSTLKVVNALGQVVLEQNDLTEQIKLDISSLPNGIYFIYQLQEQKTVAMSKLIKQ